MKRMLKVKPVLAAAALALSFVLAVSGVLMLFTAHTAVATNAVSISAGVSGQLSETKGDGWQTTTDNDGVMLDYGVQWSGETIVKRPKVVRDDADPDKAAPAYVAVKAEPVLAFDGDLLAAVNSFTDHVFTQADIDAFKASMIDPSSAWWYNNTAAPSTDPNWVYCLNAPDDSYGWFFYVDGSGNLKRLPPKPAETSEIFTNIEIPPFTDPDQLELFAALGRAGVKLDFRLTAYLVMADSGSHGTAFGNYIAPFGDLLGP